MHQDRAALEHPHRLCAAAVHQRRDLGVRVDLDKAGAELVALADVDQPGVIFGARVALGQQLLQHHGDLHPVRSRQRVQLQRVLADRQFLVMGGAGNGAVGGGKLAAIAFFPFPDFRRGVGGIAHLLGLVLIVPVPCQSHTLGRSAPAEIRGYLQIPMTGRSARGNFTIRSRGSRLRTQRRETPFAFAAGPIMSVPKPESKPAPELKRSPMKGTFP